MAKTWILTERKCIMKKKLLTAITIFLCSLLQSQTNVSGGIYANTIWTKANSPYIVTVTVVVFPGITLTIEPGVTVKFNNNQYMEIRQGHLIARGKINDSIIFTSNAAVPAKGNWKGIYLNGGTLDSLVNYCNFRYADRALYLQSSVGSAPSMIKNSSFIYNNYGSYFGSPGFDSCTFINNTNGLLGSNYLNYCVFSKNGTGATTCAGIIQNCIINNNGTGIDGISASIKKCTVRDNQIGLRGISNGSAYPIDSCIISHNREGIFATNYAIIKNNILDSNKLIGIQTTGGNSIINNLIRYSGIGIDEGAGNPGLIIGNTIEYDSIGLSVGIPNDEIHCNKICNNISYNLRYTGNFNTTSGFCSNNYWCTTDSASTAVKIFDGYDNTTLGLVKFMPLDNTQCYLSVGIKEFERDRAFTLFPNPSAGAFTIEFGAILSGQFILTNAMGETTYSEQLIDAKQMEINLDLTPGIYFMKVETVNGSLSKKIIIQK